MLAIYTVVLYKFMVLLITHLFYCRDYAEKPNVPRVLFKTSPLGVFATKDYLAYDIPPPRYRLVVPLYLFVQLVPIILLWLGLHSAK